MTLNEQYCDLLDNDNGFDNQLLADRCETICRRYTENILRKYIQSERLQFKQRQGDFTIEQLLIELEK